MKPLRLKIQDVGKIKRVPLDIVEKDYALSYVLAGIAKEPSLCHSLVFKGGTALKKLYFGEYRFSVDLDFSVIEAPKKQDLEKSLINAVNISSKLLANYGPFAIQLKRNAERAPHPFGQEAFSALVKFPWHREPLCTIKIEITHDEPVILKPEYRPILHGYDEELDCKVACYHVEEIIAEKLRALLQTHKKLINRGWNRPRARDYYDLWNVLKNYSDSIEADRLIDILDRKCNHRDISYQSIEDFFTPELINEANQHWKNTLGRLVLDLPKCESVLIETKQLISRIIKP